MNEIMLIDLSSIAHPIWHMSQSEPDPNATSTKVVDRIRALASQHPHAAVCCDSGRSFRADIDPTYKANRPAQEAPLHHQIALAREQLAADGFPVWAVKGFEADDLIASATVRVLALDGVAAVIVSADKDLLQLVGVRVQAKSLRDGTIIDGEAVLAKFGVMPSLMLDYLSLVGDTSDNIAGAKGIGPVRAAELLNLFGSIDNLYAAIDAGTARLSPSVASSLAEFRARWLTVRELISLRADVPIPFDEIAAERVPTDTAPLAPEDEMSNGKEAREAEEGQAVQSAASQETAQPERIAPRVDALDANGANTKTQAVAVREPDVLAPAPVEWERQLEPRSIREAQTLAKFMYDSRLFSGYGTPAAVLSTVLAGRELGLQAMASLRGIHIVEGRHMLSADLLRALVIRSGLAKTFRCTERTNERATFVTQRGDDPPIELTYTIEEGRRAWSGKPDGWDKSGWGRNPADMLVARASSKIARLVYPEVVHGLYAPEEFDHAGQ